MQNYTKISIIIPAYNAGKTIKKCLLSIRKQSYKNIELIVVDDNSIDDTYIIAKYFADKVIKNKNNLGEGASRNIGAKSSSGDILVHTDADVVTPERWIENIINNMKRYNVKCVGGGYGNSIGNSFIEKFALYELEHRRRELNGFVNTLVSNNFACTPDIFFEFGGFSEKFKCEDLRLSYNISRKYKIYWDKNNGVNHHFRNSIKGYLRQQFNFAKDTIASYIQYPKLLFHRTHQGYSLYLEALLTILGIIILLTNIRYLPIIIATILILNLNFFKFLRHKRLSLLKSGVIIIMRNITCCLGILYGIIYCPLKLIRA